MLRKWGALVLLLLATPVFAYAQSTGKLAGRVVDAAGEPLPGANVVLEGTTLGTATDVDGNYFIIGVPVGTYDIQASFVGFQSQTVQGVEINAGYTRELNFTLQEGAQLDEIVVEYERPLIQKDAIGAPRTVTAETIENLPVRGVGQVAAIQGGVVSNEGSGNLFIRGGREEEVVYFVDGVKVVGLVGVPQQAVQEQEMLIGTIPARYGDVQSGVISITTKSGIASGFFGTVEAITSEVLDDFGYSLGSLSIGGPIVQNRLSFFASVEGVYQADQSPYAVNTLSLSDDVFDALQANPQVIEVTGPEGDRFVQFPGDIPAETSLDALEALMIERGLITADDAVIGTPTSAAFFLTEEDFDSDAGKDHPQTDINTSGNLTFQPTQNTSLRFSGAFNNRDEETFNFVRSLYARNVFYDQDQQTWRAAATWRQYLSNSTFYEITADYSQDRFRRYPTGFSDDISEALFYGDVDGVDANGNPTPGFDANATARNYWEYNPDDDLFERRYRDGSLPGGSGVYGLFGLPGTALTRYTKQDRQQFRLSANATTQVGVHQIEFGGEFEQRTERLYDLVAGNLATYYNDGNPEAGQAEAVDSYDELSFDAIQSLIVGGSWYGYDYLGLNETDDGDIDAFANGESYDIAPYQPVYYAGYVRDKVEFRDVILDLGLRVDVFDNNTQILSDPFAFTPLVRAGDVSASTPANIEDDYAVYFAGGNASGEIVGYRDLEGTFYDANGAESNRQAITNLGTAAELEGAPQSSAFEDYEPQVTFMPRIGVSFPVTDQALFFASYNVLSQRPTERSYLAPEYHVLISSGSAFDNPALQPEKTTQYELGFRQRVGARAALQISGFYRTQQNKIGRRTLNASFPSPGYYGHFNVDFTTTKGATFEFDLRRTRGIAVNANYTLSFAQGTGSDAATAATIAWRGNYFPDFITPAGFDRRHSVNVSLDYRLGEGEGPMVGGTHILQNFGFNILGVVQSGQPYTQLQTPVTSPIFLQTNNFVQGGINDARFPWTNRVDLRLDRRFQLGGSASLTAFLWVQNLLDQDNVFGLYRGSGLPDDDGFLNGGSAADAIASAEDGDSYVFHYDYYTDNPTGAAQASFSGTSAYGLPRRTRLGVRLNF